MGKGSVTNRDGTVRSRKSVEEDSLEQTGYGVGTVQRPEEVWRRTDEG